jgi:hypothetical protein
MANPRYRLQTKSNGQLPVEYNTADPTTWTRGQTATFEFELGGQNSVTFDADYTVSDGETYDSVTVPSGTTLTIPDGATLFVNTIVINGDLVIDGELVTGTGAFQNLSEFVEWAGNYTTQTMLNGVRKYREQIPDTIGIDTLVVGVTPSEELQANDVVGVWGLIDQISNQRNQPLTTDRYQVDVTVLAPLDEYNSVTDVESDLLI